MTVAASSPSSAKNSPTCRNNNASSSSKMFTSQEFINCAQRVEKKYGEGMFPIFLLQAEVEEPGNFVKNQFIYLKSESSDGLSIGVQKCIFCFKEIVRTKEDSRSFVCSDNVCQLQFKAHKELEADLQNLQFVASKNRSEASRQLVY